MYCPEHPKYTGKRAPRNFCHSCWRLYSEVNSVSVGEIIKRPQMSEAKASWLRENIDDIIYATLESEKATASFITEAEIVEQPEESKPARGIKV